MWKYSNKKWLSDDEHHKTILLKKELLIIIRKEKNNFGVQITHRKKVLILEILLVTGFNGKLVAITNS